MNPEFNNYLHSDLTEKIIGAAMAVHRELGPGLNEKIYENALCVELTAQSILFTQQEQFQVSYRNQFVGNLITDLIAEEKVIIETKVAAEITDLHISQIISYLHITKLKVGLILNFKNASLTFRRISNSHQKIIKSA